MHMSLTLINVMRHRPLPLAVPDAVAFPSEEVVCALVIELKIYDLQQVACFHLFRCGATKETVCYKAFYVNI